MSSRRYRKATVHSALVACAVMFLPADAGHGAEPAREIGIVDRSSDDDTSVRYARVALYYSPVGGILRSKGVRKVTNPHEGIYCIKPKRKFDTTRFIASVTVDWFESEHADVLAHWAGLAVNCPDYDRWFQVRTYELDFRDRQYPSPSNDVAFTFIVP